MFADKNHKQTASVSTKRLHDNVSADNDVFTQKNTTETHFIALIESQMLEGKSNLSPAKQIKKYNFSSFY